MKIGLVLDDTLDAPDGVQQYVLTIGRWLATQGHDVHYLAGHTKRTDIPNIHSLSHNIKVRFNRNKLSIPLPVSRKKLRVFLAEQKFDVLHIQMPYSPQFAGKLITEAPESTAIIGTFHILPYGHIQRVGSWLLSKILAKSLRRFDQVVSVSDAAQQFAGKVMGIQSSVVPNAVNLASFASGLPTLEITNGKQNVLFLGRLVPRKGAKELLKAIALLNQTGRFEQQRCIIVGSGPQKRRLKRFVHRHKLTDKVVFAGQISESQKANYFASSDVVVLPSLGGESFGIVVVEAIASGAGVVLGGNNPGYRFVLADTLEALVNPKDTKTMASRIDQLLSSSQLRQQFQDVQKQRIRQFDIIYIGPRILEVYTQAINKHGKV